MGEYKKSNLIKYTRERLGLTQEYVCDDICDPVTMSRYENGILNPSDVNFYRIMKRMGAEIDLINVTLPKEFACLEDNMELALKYMECGDNKRVKTIISRIKRVNQKFIIPEVEQFCGRIEVIVDYISGKIMIEDAIRKLGEILLITNIRFDCGLYRQMYSEIELLIYYNIAVLFYENKEIEKSIDMFQNLEKYIINSEQIVGDKSRYMICLQYSNILGQLGNHDKSILICKREIKWLYQRNKANYLYNYYYNIGWNLYQKDKSISDKDSLKESLCYLWISYELCNFFPENKKNISRIKKTIDAVASMV